MPDTLFTRAKDAMGLKKSFEPAKKEKQILTEIDEQIKKDKEFRQKWEIEAYVNKHFVDGNHHVVYSKSEQVIKTLPLARGDKRRTINYVRSQKRGVMSLIFKNDPRVHVRGGDMEATEEEIETAYYFIKKVWKDWNLGQLVKQVVSHGLDTGIGYMCFDWDDEKDDMKFWVEDPLNCFTDAPMDGNPESATFFIRSFKKPIYHIVNDPMYKDKRGELESLPPDGRFSLSDRLNDYYTFKFSEDKKMNGPSEGAIVIERQQKIFEDGKQKLRVTTKIGDIIARNEVVDRNRYNVLAYRPEDQPGVYYTRAWLSDMIDPQKSINNAVSNVEAWIEYTHKVKLLAPANARFSYRTDNHGQVIRYTGSQPPQFHQPPALPNTVFEHLNNNIRFMESQTIHSESQGRLSGSANSGVAIAQLQAANVNNVNEPLQNLKIFLEDLFERILEFASENYTDVRKMVFEEDGEKKFEKQIVGDRAIENGLAQDSDDTVRLKSFKKIEVEIVPGDAFSDLQQRQDAVELFQLGVLPKETVLETYKIGNTRELLDKLEKEKEENKINNPDLAIAEGENLKMAKGVSVAPQEGEDHDTHMMIHSALLSSASDAKNEQVAQIVAEHMKQTEAYIQNAAGPQVAAGPPQPAGPAAGPPPQSNPLA